MDYDNINGPMYCDFENIQNGIETDGEGDEWFDRKVEEMHDCSSILENKDEKTFTIKNVEPNNINNDDNLGTKEDDVGKIDKMQIVSKMIKAFAVGTNNQKIKKKNTKQRVLPNRTAALKATVSITDMYKPPKSSGGPAAPKLMKPRQIPKSSEQLEMEKVEQVKWEANRLKELSKQSLKRSKKQPSPAKLVKTSSTDPVGFNLKSMERRKRPSNEVGGPSSSNNVFPMNLRSNQQTDHKNQHKPATPGGGLTQVKPFRFMTEERIQQRKRHISPEQRYVSRAEFEEKFQKSTPTRFRTKVPYDIANEDNHNKKDYKTAITIPKTPKLQSMHRSRPANILSKDEREEQELENMKKSQFRATPFNPEIVRLGGELGVSKPVSRPLTKPVSPCFASKGKFSTKRNREQMEIEEKKEFKAQPMPRLIFDKVTGVPEKLHLDVTVACSPLLSFKRRKTRTESDETDAPPTKLETVPVIARPMPDFSNVFKPAIDHAHTKPHPFSFEHKYTNKADLINELVEKDIETAAKRREFHANPLPNMDSAEPLPSKVLHPNIEIKPFKLEIEERIKERQEKKVRKQRIEEEIECKYREFQATKLKDTVPFEPVKSCKPLTEFTNNVILHTALRSEDRYKYDEERKQREMEREKEEDNRKALIEAEEEERIKELRRSVVHKPLPIQDFPNINIKPSTKPLTKPHSPILVSKARNRTQ